MVSFPVTNLTRSCPVCGKGVRAQARFCPGCGAGLSAPVPSSGLNRIATSHHTSICPNCQKTIHSQMRFCRSCGYALQGVFCPLCSRANRPNVKYCAHCGMQLGVQAPTNPYETGKLPAGMILGGRYLLLRKIAQGGMGAVYEAKEVPTSTTPRLAIKEMSFSILSRLSSEQQHALVESFHREFELLSQLSHPNLVQAYQFFEEQNRLFFVMEFIEGRTLEAILDTLPPGQLLPLEKVMTWARQLCAVLHFLHTQKPPIIYRDLKPSNVMELLPPPGGNNLASKPEMAVIKLFDFGIARFYKPGQKSDTVRFGTDGYLAPEIIAYHVQTSELTDVYSLGAVLHQVLTRFDPQMDPWKRPPIRALNPQVPEHVVQAIDHALALNPAKRTQNVAELSQELFGPGERPLIDASGPVAQYPAAEPVSISQPQPFHPARIPSAAPAEAQSYLPPISGQVDQQPVLKPPISEAALHKESTSATATLNLGSIRKGKTAAGSFEVILSDGLPPSAQPRSKPVVQGRVISYTPWLKVEPEHFTGSDLASTNITIRVHARTGSLPLGHWNTRSSANSTIPAWFLSLPGILRGWLGAHLNWFVPLPARYQGLIQVSIPGNPDMCVQTLVEVLPPTWKKVIGWMLTFGMIGLEASLLFTGAYLAINLLMVYFF